MRTLDSQMLKRSKHFGWQAKMVNVAVDGVWILARLLLGAVKVGMLGIADDLRLIT